MTDSIEVACDESGYEGDALVGGPTDVFAHASVRVGAEAASACIAELRGRIRSPAQEYKANHLLREKNRAALVWLLGPPGPLVGRARVYLVDKTFLLVTTVATRLGVALGCHERWRAVHTAANTLLRTRNRDDPTTVPAFVHALREYAAGAELHAAAARAEELRRRLAADPAMFPPLDPLLPAILRAVELWGSGTSAVAIVHDQQSILSPQRIEQLRTLAAPRLVSLTLADSRDDPRVQVADFLAGVARKIASEELNGRGDAELTALLRPYVDSASVWARPSTVLPVAAVPGRGSAG